MPSIWMASRRSHYMCVPELTPQAVVRWHILPVLVFWFEQIMTQSGHQRLTNCAMKFGPWNPFLRTGTRLMWRTAASLFITTG
jgi:hypothetical protein